MAAIVGRCYPEHLNLASLGIHFYFGVQDRYVPRGGTAPVVSKVMELTLSADHRILDGEIVAQFLAELKGILEHPARLLIEPAAM